MNITKSDNHILFNGDLMEETNDTKKWFNINYIKVKVNKNKPLEKLKSDINTNSRIFFGMSRAISHEKIIEHKIENAQEDVEPTKKKSKNKRLFTILFFILNMAIVVAIFWSFANEQGGIQPLNTLFANSPKWSYLFIALGMYLATVLCNTAKFSILIHNKTGKWRLWFSFKLATIGRYYDLITPMGSGGQPFEIYYLKKDGYSGDTATAIPLAKYMIWQFAFSILCLIILIFFPQTYASSTFVLVCAWVGISVVVLLFLFVFFMSITKKMGASLVVGVLKVLHKMKIVKDYRKALEKVLRFVKQYQYCIKSFAKSPFTVIGATIATLGSIIFNALIAYFVYASFVSIPEIGWWEIICKCTICELAVCFIPLPGGSGATELSFNALLGSLFPAGTLFWGILIWRFLTYYLYILQGALILIWDLFRSRRHLKNKT